MNRKNRRSIFNRIKTTFVLIIIIMSTSFLYSNSLKNNIVEEYNHSMKINIKLNDLSIKFHNSWVHFDSYMKFHDAEAYENFLEANKSVEKIMEEAAPYVKQDKNSGIFFRNLTNMYEWYKERTSLVIAREKLDMETYEQYVKIETMYFYIFRKPNMRTEFLFSSILKKG